MTPSTNFPFDADEFLGKRALVTGGTKGIGAAIVDRLTRGGATVLTTARSAPEHPTPRDLFVGADVSTTDGVAKIVQATLDRLGGVDILVNNVGGSSAPGGGFLALSDDDWQRTFDANLFAAVRLDRGLLPSIDYVELRAADTQQQLLEETVKAYTVFLRLTTDRFRGGAAPKSDVAQAQTQLETTQVQLTDIAVQRAQFEHAIATLIGKPPAV